MEIPNEPPGSDGMPQKVSEEDGSCSQEIDTDLLCASLPAEEHICKALQELDALSSTLFDALNRLLVKIVQSALDDAPSSRDDVQRAAGAWVGKVLLSLGEVSNGLGKANFVSGYLLRKLAKTMDTLHKVLAFMDQFGIPLPKDDNKCGRSYGPQFKTAAADAATVEDSSSVSASVSAVDEFAQEICKAVAVNPSLKRLLAELVRYTCKLLKKGGISNDIRSLLHGVFWRSLPLALCAFTTETEESDTQELLTPSCIDACFQFLHDNPVAPGHAGSAILLLKPLGRSAIPMKRRELFGKRYPKQKKAATSGSTSGSPEKGSMEADVEGHMLEDVGHAYSRYTIEPTLAKSRASLHLFLERLTRLSLTVATSTDEPDWVVGEALSLVTDGLRLAKYWSCQLAGQQCFDMVNSCLSADNMEVPAAHHRYSQAELESMAEVLMWVDDIRSTLLKEKTWLIPLVVKGMGQQLAHFMGVLFSEVHQGASEKAKCILQELRHNFSAWCTEPSFTPEKPMRNNSVMQSLKDLTTLLRPAHVLSLDSPAQLPKAFAKQLSQKVPKHSASESLLSGVANLRSSLKAGLATSLKQSARSAFKHSLPALPSSKSKPTGTLPNDFEELLPLSPQQIHLLCHSLQGIILDSRASGGQRFLGRGSWLSTYARKELKTFQCDVYDWEEVSVFLTAGFEVGDTSSLWLSDYFLKSVKGDSAHDNLPILLSKTVLANSTLSQEACLAPAIVFHDCHVWATKHSLELLSESCCAAGDSWYESLMVACSSKVFSAYKQDALEELAGQWDCQKKKRQLRVNSAGRLDMLLEQKVLSLPNGTREFSKNLAQSLADLFLRDMKAIISGAEVAGALGILSVGREHLLLERCHEHLSCRIDLQDFQTLWNSADMQGNNSGCETLPDSIAASRLAEFMMDTIVEAIAPTTLYCPATLRVLLAPTGAETTTSESLAKQSTYAGLQRNSRPEIGVQHFRAFLRIIGLQNGGDLLAHCLHTQMVRVIAQDLASGFRQLHQEIPPDMLNNVLLATSVHATEQELLSSSFLHFDKVLASVGLSCTCTSLRELGCGLALLNILDVACGLEATAATVFALPICEGLSNADAETPHKAKLLAEASMGSSEPCRKVMQHLRMGLQDQLTGFSREHVKQILSLVLLATSLKAAGQPGGLAAKKRGSDPMYWGISAIFSLMESTVDFELKDIVYRISQLQATRPSGGKLRNDILGQLTAKSLEASAFMDAANRETNEALSSCKRYAGNYEFPLAPTCLNLCK
eukprot:jgi/Botrbrau1/6197/Bobra.0344s0037.1